MTIERQNKCQFCGKTFLRKAWFLRHSCKKKKQFEMTNDIVVQQAFRVYSYWAKKTNIIREKTAPKMDSFLKGPLKKPFVDMMMYAREQGIMSPYSYADWIIAKRIPQRDWSNEKRLDEFKEYIGIHEDPADHAMVLVGEIMKWVAEGSGRTPNDYFDRLTPGVILTLARKGIIRPWVLFTYPPVSEVWLGDDTYDADTFYTIDDLFNCPYWSEKIDNEPEAMDTVIGVMGQLWESQT